MQELGRRPVLTEHLDQESREHFDALGGMLRSIGVDFEVNPRRVAGLDYYSRTVFEWIMNPSAPRMPYAPAAITTG